MRNANGHDEMMTEGPEAAVPDVPVGGRHTIRQPDAARTKEVKRQESKEAKTLSLSHSLFLFSLSLSLTHTHTLSLREAASRFVLSGSKASRCGGSFFASR